MWSRTCWRDWVNWNHRRQYILIYVSACTAGSFTCLLDASWDTCGDEVSPCHSRTGSSTAGATITTSVSNPMRNRHRRALHPCCSSYRVPNSSRDLQVRQQKPKEAENRWHMTSDECLVARESPTTATSAYFRGLGKDHVAKIDRIYRDIWPGTIQSTTSSVHHQLTTKERTNCWMVSWTKRLPDVLLWVTD